MAASCFRLAKLELSAPAERVRIHELQLLVTQRGRRTERVPEGPLCGEALTLRAGVRHE